MDLLNDLDRPDQASGVVQMIEKVYGPMPPLGVVALAQAGIASRK